MVYYDLLSSCVVLFDVVWFSLVLNGLLGLLLSCLVLESHFWFLSGIVLYNLVWSCMILYEFVMSCIILNGHVCLNAGGQEGNKLFKHLTHVFDAMASLR